MKSFHILTLIWLLMSLHRTEATFARIIPKMLCRLFLVDKPGHYLLAAALII
jgi:hypothetical protein